MMHTVFDLAGLRAQVNLWRREGATIAFVPTMGNLHDGHVSLLHRAREIANHTVASIFVNPIQFGKGEDYAKYPSTLPGDQEKLAAAGLDLLFAPNLDQLYPGGIEDDTRVTVPGLSAILCGKFRPGHFSGVATVVSKLFINVQPDFALFGLKDYQQVLVIKRMVHDLLMPIEVIGMPIVREADGLAMSSRNSYLNADERARASIIYATLRDSAAALEEGARAIADVEALGMKTLANAGFRPEYFSVRRSADLEDPVAGDAELSILVAAWLGGARLIDNIQLRLKTPLA